VYALSLATHKERATQRVCNSIIYDGGGVVVVWAPLLWWDGTMEEQQFCHSFYSEGLQNKTSFCMGDASNRGVEKIRVLLFENFQL